MKKDDESFRVDRDHRFTIVANRALEDNRLDKYDIRVYMALSYFADYNTKHCYPSYSKIMEISRIKSPKTISSSLQKLEELGYIVRSSGHERRKVNHYLVRTTSPQEVTTSQEELTSSQEELTSSPQELTSSPQELDKFPTGTVTRTKNKNQELEIKNKREKREDMHPISHTVQATMDRLRKAVETRAVGGRETSHAPTALET